RVEAGRVRVEDAGQTPPTIPFWLGESPARTVELSRAVSELRADVATRVRDLAIAAAPLDVGGDAPVPSAGHPGTDGTCDDGRFAPVVEWLIAESGVDRGGAEQIVESV